jgi:hypothetical protein
MPLTDALQTILTQYAEARSKPFAGHSLPDFIRHGAVKDTLGELGAFASSHSNLRINWCQAKEGGHKALSTLISKKMVTLPGWPIS